MNKKSRYEVVTRFYFWAGHWDI